MVRIQPPDSPRERLDRVRLIRSQNVGPVSLRQLLLRFGSAGDTLQALPELTRQGGLRKTLSICSSGIAAHEVDFFEKFRRIPNHYWQPRAPDAPPVLSVLGDADMLRRIGVGVVGTRNASTHGRRFAGTLGRCLAQAGVAVVSGLARDITRPPLHPFRCSRGWNGGGTRGWRQQYLSKGERRPLRGNSRACAIVSKMPPGTEPQALHFPTRSRIISGLSFGVVVEAALRWGSLITARLVGEQRCEVFAIPGSPLDPRARGANALIRNGATLAENAEDVLEGIRPILDNQLDEPDMEAFPNADADDAERDAGRATIFECLGPTPVKADDVLRYTKLSASTVWMILLELELAGRLERLFGGRVALLV